MKRMRFIEKDWWINHIKKNSDYIEINNVENVLPEMDYADLTFIFDYKVTGNGFTVKIIDNTTEQEVSVDELNNAAYEFFVNEVKMISILQQLNSKEHKRDRVNNSISQIKSMINSWKNEKVVAQ
jgi:hypothetical protein